jgi:hypothetical protein
MEGVNMRFEKFMDRRLGATVAFITFALLVAGCAPWCLAQQPRPKTFSSCEEASRALLVAVQNQDQQALTEILGAGRESVLSGDEVQDQLDRDLFIQKYQQMHRLVREPDRTTVLYIGAENWPFPFPLVSENSAWYFEPEAGRQEVLFRRIGENEVTAIQTCSALVLAAKQPQTKPDADDPVSRYAQSLVRTGRDASNPVPASRDKDSDPFHGYYFRRLTRQGKNAPGGVKNYNSNTEKTGGFAFVAYPVEYRSSGVTTFIINQDGVVYEKDLGPNTAKLAKAMTAYHPDRTWHAAK